MMRGMRTRILTLTATLAVGLAMLPSTPALATYGVTISFPGGGSAFYSPFNGAATVAFTFDGSEPDQTFGFRLRPAGGTAVFTDTIFVDADAPAGTFQKNITWPALSVTSDRTYEVLVYLNGAVVASESFLLQPKLVQITSANPNPFLPWLLDGIKDVTTIHFTLSNATQATDAHVYRANARGRCCGAQIETEDIGGLGAGPWTWEWDGRNGANDPFAKGDYFVKVRGQDASDVVGWSKPFKVSIARTYMKSATKEKSATAYHHIGPVTSYLRGGNCFATDAQTDLWITCLHAKFTIYWRWGLASGAKITKVSFTFVPVSGDICKYTKGSTATESWMRAGTESGQVRCRVDLAKITYSTPTPS